ncbi:MAG: L-threonylcarbamoyladenylate synthase [Desulfatiglandales bacterium]|nr:L-threonylcarbamoyladenylate synthase [Desulfatiglandales bacterium]
MGKIIEQGSFIRMDTDEALQAGVKKALEVIISGGVVAYPTESFYGLAVNTSDEEAIQRLFEIKERQSDHPILILTPSVEVLGQYVVHISEIIHRLIKQFWPGGLTLIFEAKPNISPLLTAGTGKIGVRLSSHPVATALAKAVGVPITGTSANISGQPSCTDAKEVFHSLGKTVDLILDGGETKGGLGSTILDVMVDPPAILREGIVDRKQLKEFLRK